MLGAAPGAAVDVLLPLVLVGAIMFAKACTIVRDTSAFVGALPAVGVPVAEEEAAVLSASFAARSSVLGSTFAAACCTFEIAWAVSCAGVPGAAKMAAVHWATPSSTPFFITAAKNVAVPATLPSRDGALNEAAGAVELGMSDASVKRCVIEAGAALVMPVVAAEVVGCTTMMRPKWNLASAGTFSKDAVTATLVRVATMLDEPSAAATVQVPVGRPTRFSLVEAVPVIAVPAVEVTVATTETEYTPAASWLVASCSPCVVAVWMDAPALLVTVHAKVAAGDPVEEEVVLDRSVAKKPAGWPTMTFESPRMATGTTA